MPSTRVAWTVKVVAVALVAVCGIPGSGKSTICLRLKELGLDAWDTDTDRLSGFRNAVTKEWVPGLFDFHDAARIGGLEYATRRDKIAELRARADTVAHTVYLCGPGGDQHEYWDLLDRVLELAVDNDTLLHRLATRTTNTYGKDPETRDAILDAYNGGWVESYRERGAVIIDATRSLDEVVAAVIAAAEGGPCGGPA